MKSMINLISKKKILVFIPVVLLAIIIWYLGPITPIAHHFPLKDPQRRIAFILTLFIAWLVKFLFLDDISVVTQDDLNVANLLHSLRGRFLGVIRFLKKTTIDKHGYTTPLNKLPWHLIIGPPGAGKTSLLAYSNINFILAKQYKQEKPLISSTVCNWSVTRDLVLVDVPGCYAFSPLKDSLTDTLKQNNEQTTTATPHLYLILWKNLLYLLTKYRQKNNIAAIIVALNLPEIIKQPRQQQTQWFQDMKQRLIECWEKFGKLPVYFIITKCDLLPGFCEFFNDMGSDELVQPWGIPLSPRKEHEKLLDLFVHRFNALTNRLNKQLIWRLHHERDSKQRPMIKDFPLQLEFLKETLIHLIKTLTAVNSDFALEGIYLTSATQENISSKTTTLFHHDVPSPLQVLPPAPFISRTYFIKHIISYLLPHTSHHQCFHKKNVWVPPLLYGTTFSLLLIAALWFGKDFQRQIYQASTIQQYVSQYQLYLQQHGSENFSIENTLPLLNTLKKAAMNQDKNNHLQQLWAFYSTKSQQTAPDIYQQALQTIVMPQIKNEFEKYLSSASDKSPEQLYVVLKAYLMLAPPQDKLAKEGKENVYFIVNTLSQISPLFSKKSLNKESFQHIENTLSEIIISHPSLTNKGNVPTQLLNTKLITQARKILNSLSDEDLAYVILKTMANNSRESEINLGTNIGTPPALISKGTATEIPYMFTAQAFPQIIKEEIPLAARETIVGNGVLGKRLSSQHTTLSNTSIIPSLTKKLETTYTTNYIDVWESLISNISLNLPKNLTETDAMILNLISDHSPLLQLLQGLHANVYIPSILSNSPKLQALNTLFNQTQSQQKDSLYQIFVDLHELHTLLQHDPTSGTVASAQTEQSDPVARIRMMAESYPEPIKNWLQTLVSCTQNHLQHQIKGGIPAKEPVKEVLQNALKKVASTESSLAKEKESLPSSHHKKLAQDKHFEHPHTLSHGEYVRKVMTKNKQSLIFVRKD